MVSFKSQLVSEVSQFRRILSREELSEKIVDVIHKQILPDAIMKANLHELPSPISLKREELISARYGERARRPLHEKMTFLQDLEKLRYEWNGSELTDVALPTSSVETLQTTFRVFPKTELEIKQVEKPLSFDIDVKQDVSPAPFWEYEEKIKHYKLIDFDMKVTEKIVKTPSYANLIGIIESMIRENYSLGKNFFSFSIKVDEDFPSREKTTITIDLPDSTFEQKMDFWKKIEMYIKEIIEHLNVSEDEKKKISRNLFTHVKA